MQRNMARGRDSPVQVLRRFRDPRKPLRLWQEYLRSPPAHRPRPPTDPATRRRGPRSLALSTLLGLPLQLATSASLPWPAAAVRPARKLVPAWRRSAPAPQRRGCSPMEFRAVCRAEGETERERGSAREWSCVCVKRDSCGESGSGSAATRACETHLGHNSLRAHPAQKLCTSPWGGMQHLHATRFRVCRGLRGIGRASAAGATVRGGATAKGRGCKNAEARLPQACRALSRRMALSLRGAPLAQRVARWSHHTLAAAAAVLGPPLGLRVWAGEGACVSGGDRFRYVTWPIGAGSESAFRPTVGALRRQRLGPGERRSFAVPVCGANAARHRRTRDADGRRRHFGGHNAPQCGVEETKEA